MGHKRNSAKAVRRQLQAQVSQRLSKTFSPCTIRLEELRVCAAQGPASRRLDARLVLLKRNRAVNAKGIRMGGRGGVEVLACVDVGGIGALGTQPPPAEDQGQEDNADVLCEILQRDTKGLHGRLCRWLTGCA